MDPRVLEHHIAGDGDTLVLVPGGLTGWLSWIPHQERLADHHRAVRVQPIHNELGGAGQVGDPGYSVEVERESLRMTVERLGVEQADFAGWSSGARALIEFAAAYPGLVRSLTLVEPPSYWIIEDEVAGVDPAAREVDEFLAGMAGTEVSEDDLAAFLVLAGFGNHPDEVRQNPNWGTWVSVRNALSWQGYIAADQPSRDIGAITCPVLLVYGTVTTPWEKQVTQLLGERLPDARVVELEGDHASHIQSMDRFLEEMEEHLHQMVRR